MKGRCAQYSSRLLVRGQAKGTHCTRSLPQGQQSPTQDRGDGGFVSTASRLLPDSPMGPPASLWSPGDVFYPHKTCHPGYKEGKKEKGGHQVLRTEQRPPRPAWVALGQLHVLSGCFSSVLQGRWDSRPSKLLSGMNFLGSNSTVLGGNVRDVGATSQFTPSSPFAHISPQWPHQWPHPSPQKGLTGLRGCPAGSF